MRRYKRPCVVGFRKKNVYIDIYIHIYAGFNRLTGNRMLSETPRKSGKPVFTGRTGHNRVSAHIFLLIIISTWRLCFVLVFSMQM